MVSADRGGRVRMIQKLRAQSLGQRTGAAEKPRCELAKRAAIGPRAIRPEPSRAPQVEQTSPRGQRRILRVQCSQRPRLLADDRCGVVWLRCELQPDPDGVLDNRRQAVLGKQGQLLLASSTYGAASGLAPEIVRRAANQAVAGDQVVV